MRAKAFVAAALGLGLVVSSLRADAQPERDPAAADALFEHGKELLRTGQWSEACAKFQASMELDPAVGTLLKLAKCSEHEGKLALALHEYRAALTLTREKTDQTEARRAELEAFTRAALAELEPRVPRLRVVVDPPPSGLKVSRGGEDLPLAALGEDLPVDPGPIEVVASAPGYETVRRQAVLAEGSTSTVSIQLSPVGAPDTLSPSDRPAAPDRIPARDHGELRVAAYVVGAAGIVSLGLATYFGVVTVNKVSQASPYCMDDRCYEPGYNLIGQAHGTQTAAFVLLAAGATCAAAGTFLFFQSRARSSPSASLALSPMAAVVRGTW